MTITIIVNNKVTLTEVLRPGVAALVIDVRVGFLSGSSVRVSYSDPQGAWTKEVIG